MSAGTFLLSMVRVLLAVGAAGVAGRRIATRLGYGADVLGRLASTVVAVSLVLVWAEVLGLVGELRSAPLIAGLIVAAVVAWRWSRDRTTPSALQPRGKHSRRIRLLAAGAVAIVLAQWFLATADSLGAGMYNFDTLWYHMPFAAGFALSGSVTGIPFTQADPWVAYYPANSELVHAVGLVLMHGDLLSPVINLGWLVILALGAWCFGRPWGREVDTLVAGCLLAGLPVLASTQPGEAFNDMAGLAMLVAACALLVNAPRPASLAIAGLALGFSLAVKFTFVVPVLVIAAGVCVTRRRRAAALVGALLVTAGWWYLRNLIEVGNPLGTRLHLGPLVLPGPRSPLAASSQQTVLSQLGHAARLNTGMVHMLGVLWPLIVLGGATATAAAIVRGAPTVRTLGWAAAAAGLTYLVLPTGAAGLGAGTVLFEVNLRYAAPALALALLLLALAPRGWIAAAMLVALLVSQAERSLWPASPARHVAFLVAAVAATGLVWGLRARPVRLLAAPVLAAGAVLALAGGYVIGHHYLQRRYRTGLSSDPALGTLYGWAQTVAHSRIALYGTVEQYPLYGALVTNRVDYLGTPTGDGGYAPITSCAAWRRAIDRERAQYVVMTPGPTGSAPLTWTAGDAAARVVLALGPGAAVFALSGPVNPRGC